MAEATKIKTGTSAPAFSLPDADGDTVSLDDFKGSWVVLYFYPKDNTSGCTREAIDFTSRLVDFKKLDAHIIGISPDTCESHQKFIIKHDLRVLLLSDTDKNVLKAYDVWTKKNMYGREYFGVTRTTYLIDPEGKIAHKWDKISVPGHVDDVFLKLKELHSRKESD